MGYNTHVNKYHERMSSYEKVPETTTSTIEGAVNALQNDAKAEEIANDIVDAVKTGAAKEDVANLLATLEKYINDKGIGSDEIKDPGALRDIADAFLTDAGVDVEALNNAISNSIIANDDETTTEPEAPTEPEPDVPACGFVG